MATQAEYTALANDLVAYATGLINNLPEWERGFIPMDKLPQAAGAASKHCIDFIDNYRAAHKEVTNA